VADAIIAGPRGGLRGPFEPWLRSPLLADRAQKLGEYCRFNNSLSKDLAELAICLVGRHFKAQYEFYAHARLAKEAGLSADLVEAVRTRQTPPFARAEERIVYDFVSEYLETNRVAQPNYKRAIDAFGEQGVVDLVGVCGYYMLVSMTLNVFEMPLPPGVPEPLV
jgi:4-carboxymuconolactone decarboxylase